MARILVVEDDVDQLNVRRQILEHAGFEVVGAQSAAEALPLLPGCRVVLTDLRVPALEDGMQLIRAASAAAARIIVLSGADADVALPVDEFLTKPCSSKKLLETVAKFCALGRGA